MFNYQEMKWSPSAPRIRSSVRPRRFACLARNLGGLAVLGLVSAATVQAHAPASESIAALSRDLGDEPSAELLLRRAEMFRVSGNAAAAYRDCDAALQLDPALRQVHLCRARIAAFEGRATDALEAVRVYLDADGTIGNDRSLGEREAGRAHARLGDLTAAVDAFQRAASFADPTDPADYLEPAEILRATRPVAAIAVLDRGIGTLGELQALQATAIEVAAQMGDWNDALRRVDRILADAPRRERWLTERGRLLVAAGRQGEAWVAFTSALEELDRLTPVQRSVPAVRRLEEELNKALRPKIATEMGSG